MFDKTFKKKIETAALNVRGQHLRHPQAFAKLPSPPLQQGQQGQRAGSAASAWCPELPLDRPA